MTPTSGGCAHLLACGSAQTTSHCSHQPFMIKHKVSWFLKTRSQAPCMQIGCWKWHWHAIFVEHSHTGHKIVYCSALQVSSLARKSVWKMLQKCDYKWFKGTLKRKLICAAFINKLPSTSSKEATLTMRTGLGKPVKTKKWKTGRAAACKWPHQLSVMSWILTVSAEA